MIRQHPFPLSRIFLLILIMCGSVHFLWADPATPDQQESEDHTLVDWNIRRTSIQKRGMLVLASWAVSNFAVSGYAMTKEEGVSFYFHQMNTLWNVVNLSIAGIAYAGASKSSHSLVFAETVREYRSFSRILLVNAALDLGYIGTGFYLRHRSRLSELHGERLEGYGNSLILQGSFLFLFDVILAMVNQTALTQFIDNRGVEISAIPTGVMARFSW
jgi:hypothetical protein